ncbi:MAG: DUF2332 domain-containing protein [Rhizobiaceae bacterium]
MTSSHIHEHLEKQASSCEAMGSPFTAAICRALAVCLDQSTRTGRYVLNWPGDPRLDALAMRFCGGLHALVIGNIDADLASAYPPNQTSEMKLADLVGSAIKRHDDWLFEFISSPPQTNEIARSAALLPGLLSIARQTGLPLALHEVGSSAGLNLFPDRYRYRYDNVIWGDQTFPHELTPAIRGAIPDLSGELIIASRCGNDIAPIDIKDYNNQQKLGAFIWPDQSERQHRLDAAILVAQQSDFLLTHGDAADFVDSQLRTRSSGEVFVLFHSVVWQYLPQATKDRITASMHLAGRDASAQAPIAWLTMEGSDAQDTTHAVINLTLWPQGKTRTLGYADFHVRWLDWFAS